jgi:hypothetical protein
MSWLPLYPICELVWYLTFQKSTQKSNSFVISGDFYRFVIATGPTDTLLYVGDNEACHKFSDEKEYSCTHRHHPLFRLDKNLLG